MEVDAIVMGDLHLHVWKNSFGELRKKSMLKSLQEVKGMCKKYKCPLLLTGDIWHTPEALTNEDLNIFLPVVVDLANSVETLAISGNHDEVPGYSYVNLLSSISGLKLVGDKPIKIKGGYKVYGINYIKHNIGFQEKVHRMNPKGKSLLLTHSDYHNARDSDGRMVGSVDNLPVETDRLFKKFTQVFSGHIHKYQKLGKKVIMVGSPWHTRSTDRGCDMGVVLLLSTGKTKFYKLDGPEYKVLGEDGDGSSADYWVEPKVKVIEDDKDQEVNSFTDSSNREELAKGYLKAKKIKDKNKINHLIKIMTDE